MTKPLTLGRPTSWHHRSIFSTLAALAIVGSACVGSACAPGEVREGLGPEEAVSVLHIGAAPDTIGADSPTRFRVYGTTVGGDSVGAQADWGASGGSITSEGIFTATETGRYKVRARSHDNLSLADSTEVVVVPAVATVTGVLISPDTAQLQVSESENFAAEEEYSDGRISVASMQWSATGGTITSDGQYTAGSNAGTYRVIGRHPNGKFADTSVVVVSAATLTGIALSPHTTAVQAGGTATFSVTGFYSDGSQGSATVTYTAAGGTITSGGVYTAGSTAGSFNVVAKTSGGLADTAVVSIDVPVPTVSQIIVTPPSATVALGATQQFNASALLSNGTTTSASVTYSVTGGTVTAGGLYTAGATAGTFRVIATQQGGTLADTAAITIPAPTLQQVILTPATAAAQTSGIVQFSVSGRLSNGASTTPLVVYTATGGTITANGLYTAGSTGGSFRVIAREQGGTLADTSTVTVTVPAPTLTSLTLTPATASVAAGATRQFSVAAAWSDGGVTVPGVTYTATGGTISTSGLYTAGSTAGSYRVIVRHTAGTLADTSTVTVTVASTPTLTAVELTPATASVTAGSTQQFGAVGRMSDNSTSSVTVTYTATGGTINSSGLYTAGATAGSFRVIATQQSGTLADTAAVTVTEAATPSASVADPTLLPAVTTQVKNVTAYTALHVPAMAGGTSYSDPVTGARVWKVTSPSVPASNTGAGHDYSEGPVQVSREWGGNKHTILARVDGRPYYLVDLTRGVGLSNWRQLPSGATPAGNQAASFSQNPATPQILYVVTGSKVVRVNTATNQIENTGKFGTAVALGTWLTIDKNDTWFVGFGSAASSVTAWNSVTGEVRTKTFSGLDEPYFERNGRYILANNGSKTSTVWDLQDNTTRSLTAPGNSNWGHNPALRGFFVTYDVNTGGGQLPTWRVDPAQGATSSEISTLDGYAPDAHSAGQWIQEDADLPGNDAKKQWFVRTTYNWSYDAYGSGVKEGVGFLRADGSDFRLLAHHYSVNAGTQDRYWSQPHGTISPDGKIVLFDSNMNNGASPNRNDLFAVEVPTR